MAAAADDAWLSSTYGDSTGLGFEDDDWGCDQTYDDDEVNEMCDLCECRMRMAVWKHEAGP